LHILRHLLSCYQIAEIRQILSLCLIYHNLHWGWLPWDSNCLSFSHIHFHSKTFSNFSGRDILYIFEATVCSIQSKAYVMSTNVILYPHTHTHIPILYICIPLCLSHYGWLSMTRNMSDVWLIENNLYIT
jgi:hypothetical protein